jgi:predicted RNA-binding protein
MCQTSVMLEKGGEEEVLLENVITLEVLESSLKITTLFEGQKEFTGVAINRIDFAGGKVYLRQTA